MNDVPVLSITPVNGKLVYGEGIHLGYRAWLKEQLAHGVAPAYPFGFGLGYTTFDLGSPTAPAALTVGADLIIDVPVENTEQRAGREVVQVYLSRDDSAVERPVRWLASFAEITLAPQTSGIASVCVPSRSFAHYDGGWHIEEGTFKLLVGRHANDDEFQALEVRLTSNN